MKNKVYHTSPPFEIPHTGDYDYGTAIIRILQGHNLEIEYLTLRKALITSDIQETVRELTKGVNVLKKDVSLFANKFENWKQDIKRKNVIGQIKDYILKDAENSYYPILNLQLRPPDTGFAFIPEDIEDFKKSGIKVNITCHEYQLNGIDRVPYQAVLHKYFILSDTVTFFNLSDFTSASKHANHIAFNFDNFPLELQAEWKEYGEGKFEVWRDNFTHLPYNLADKVIMSRVPPTVGYKTVTFEQFNRRKPYIVVFGSIREKKGIEHALDLAQTIAKTNTQAAEKIRVKILGTPFGDNLCKTMLKLVNARFVETVINSVLYAHGGPKSNRAARSKLQEHLGAWVKVDEWGAEYIDTSKLNTFLQDLLDKENELGCQEKVPIDIHIGFTDEEVIQICHEARYAVKFDNKGWANNASAHITPLLNSCILYTGCGVNTSKEVLKGGKYEGAVVFLGNKYSLKDRKKLTVKQKKKGEQQKFYKLKTIVPNDDEVSDKELITSEMVLKDILKREHDPSLNQHTFNKAQQLSQEFTTILGKEFKEALIDQEERYKQCHKPSIQEKLIKLETQRLLVLLKQENNRGLSDKLKKIKDKSINSSHASKQVEELLVSIVSSLIQEHTTGDREKIYNFTSVRNLMLQDLWLQAYNGARIFKLDINYLPQITSSFEFYKLMKQVFIHLSGTDEIFIKWFLGILDLSPQFNVIGGLALAEVPLNKRSINPDSIVTDENASNVAAHEQRTRAILTHYHSKHNSHNYFPIQPSSEINTDFQDAQNELLSKIEKMEKIDTFTLPNGIPIVLDELKVSINSSNVYYTADFMNAVLYNINNENIIVYPANTAEQLNNFHEIIPQQKQRYAFMPLNVSYDDKETQHKNHWIALIIDKEHKLVFYLDPAQKTNVPSQVTSLAKILNYNNPVILNPINFQQAEQDEDWIRHCGVYIVEIFNKFYNTEQIISGYKLADPNINNSVSVQTILSDIPCGEAENIIMIRKKHIEVLYEIIINSTEKEQKINYTGEQ